MKVWKVLQRPVTLEADIPLKSEAPLEIIEKYESQYSNKLVAWVTESGENCGVIQNNRSVSAELTCAESVTLHEMKPAKGWGWVGLTIKDSNGEVLATFFQSRHSEQSLKWLKVTQKILAKSFFLKEEFEDLGCDA